jgi:hypothetical protein
LERILHRRRADEFKCSVDAARNKLLDFVCDAAGVQNDMGHATALQQLGPVGSPGSTEHSASKVLRDRRRSKANTRRTTPNQQRLPLLQLQRFEETSPRRLQRLRQCSELLPTQITSRHFPHVSRGDDGVFRVAALDLSAHAAHDGGYDIAFLELSRGRGGNFADAFNA